MCYYHHLMAFLYKALRELVDVALHATHIGIKEVRHHANAVLSALQISMAEGVCVRTEVLCIRWTGRRILDITSPSLAHFEVWSWTTKGRTCNANPKKVR